MRVEEPALGSTDRQRARGRRQHLWHHPKLPPAVWEQPGLELPGAQQGCCPRMQRSVLSKWFLSSAWSPSCLCNPVKYREPLFHAPGPSPALPHAFPTLCSSPGPEQSLPAACTGLPQSLIGVGSRAGLLSAHGNLPWHRQDIARAAPRHCV